MTAGRLAAAKPGATTNTVLYRCPTTVTGSTVVNVCNQSGTAATYRMALRNYDQVLHLDGPESANGGQPSSYKFVKGNPFSAYKLTLNPGYSFGDALPGTEFTTTNGAKAKILDIFKPTADVTYYTIVQDIVNVALGADTLAGTLEGGETLTGATSGLTSIYRGGDQTSVNMNVTPVTSGATTFNISRTTGLADGQYLTVAGGDDTQGEVVSIDASGIDTTANIVTVTRGALGTTPAAIPPFYQANAWSSAATVSTIDEGATFVAADATLTVADSTGFITGSYILVDNEIMYLDDVNGNDLTVTRGKFGTSDVDHNNGVNVTLLIDNGAYLCNSFSEGENITGGTSNASAALDFGATTSLPIDTKYLVSLTSNVATDHIALVTSNFNIDRTYIFDLSDASNNNYPLKLSADDPEGPNGATGTGTEYTQGVSKVGTAGTAGAYTSIAVNDTTTANLFVYADGTPAGETQGVGFGVSVQTDPTYDEIFIYDVSGEALVAGDTFTVNDVTQTVLANGVTAGPYGYVMDWDPAKAHLKIALGEGSTAIAANAEFYDTPTLNNGNRTIVKAADGKLSGISSTNTDANRVAGTYANLTPDATDGSGNLAKTKFTVVVDGSGAATVTIVDGGEGHENTDIIQINDGQLGNGGAAALSFAATAANDGVAVSQTQLYSDEDYFFYDEDVAATTNNKNSGIIVGPGENILVYSSVADISYVANGFESPSDDFTVVNLTKVSTDEGGDAAAP
jgi:hypothetical protein